MASVAIRQATAADVPSLAQLRYEFRAAQDPAVEPAAEFIARCTRWMSERLSKEGRWRCWVAEDAGQLIGTLWLQLMEKIPNPVDEAECHGYISSVYVVPTRRGAGIGSQLVDAGLRYCEAEKLDAVILWPTEASRRLYQRHGFAPPDDLFERRLG